MDIIRSSVPSPFAVPVIRKPAKPTVSDLNEYLSLYVQRPIIPEPLRQSFNAGLGSLLLERQPNYMAKPVIAPTASIFPMNVGAPQAPFMSRLGALPAGVDIYKLAFDDAALQKYVTYMTKDEMDKANSIRVDGGLKAFDFDAALAKAVGSQFAVAAPTSPTVLTPEMLAAAQLIERQKFVDELLTPGSDRNKAMVDRLNAVMTPALYDSIYAGDVKALAAAIVNAQADYMYLWAKEFNGGTPPRSIDSEKFKENTKDFLGLMALTLLPDSSYRALSAVLTTGKVSDILKNALSILDSSEFSQMANFMSRNAKEGFYEVFMRPNGLVDAVKAGNASLAGRILVGQAIVAAYLVAFLLNQRVGFVPGAKYFTAIEEAKVKLATAKTEYDALKASLELKIAELGTANEQLTEVRAQLVSKVSELAAAIADREANYIAKANLESAGYVSKADLTKAQLELQEAAKNYADAKTALDAATADHAKVQSDFAAYKELVKNDYMLKSACKLQTGATFGQRFKALFSRK